MIRSRLEKGVERALFASRWLLAPFYVGLAISLLVLLAVFVISLGDDIRHLTQTSLAKLPEAGILMALSMIDLTLTGNLVIIVILSGYENFVSRIEVNDGEGRPDWLGRVGFSNLKI